MKRLIQYSALMALLASCSTTVDFKTPGNRFHGPEVTGDTLNRRVQLGYGKAHKYETASLYGDTIFGSGATKNTDGKIQASEGFTLDAQLGVIEKLDAYYRATHDSAAVFGLKYQPLGTHDQEGHKIAIMAGLGQGSEDKDAHKVKSDSTERLYKARLDIDAWEVELIYGYRYNKNVLVYGNLNYANYDTDTELKSDSFDDENINVTAKTQGFLLGVDLINDKRKAGVILEAGVVKAEWNGAYGDTNIPLGVNFYYLWE